MDKTAIKLRVDEGYTDKMPTSVGLYQMVCEENGNIADHIAISKTNETLIVHDPNIGRYDLKHYHENLIHIMWKKIA